MNEKPQLLTEFFLFSGEPRNVPDQPRDTCVLIVWIPDHAMRVIGRNKTFFG
jgi:hypothetical protein